MDVGSAFRHTSLRIWKDVKDVNSSLELLFQNTYRPTPVSFILSAV